ncbi:cyclic GMP-AMP synthase [Anabas testudineus]|nr:cyclic GMP-AMP synthase [Anabas testudineus]
MTTVQKVPGTPNSHRKARVEGTGAKIKEKSTPQSSEETKIQPKDTTKNSPKSARTKECSGRKKSPEQFPGDVQPQRPKDTTKAYLKTTKAKTCSDNPKSPEEFGQETTRTKSQKHLATEIQPEMQKDTRKASFKSTKGKTFTEDSVNIQPETTEYMTTTCIMQDRCEDNTAVDTILSATLEKLKIKRNDRAIAAKVINEIKKYIFKHLKDNTVSFKDVEEPLCTGSYYENVKISNPDEFDVMVPILVERVNIEPFGDDGAFYSVALKRGHSPLQKFQETGTLSASNMLKEFREEVKKCVKPFKEWTVTTKKKGCPAVTLTTEVQSVTISLDVVLCLMVKSSWPAFTNEGLKIEAWLGTKVKQEYKRKPYYLVPKYEGRGTVENDGVFAKDVWRVSFSHIEKAILKNHGSEKTCCEQDGKSCCRKDCLKLLKHLLSLLKEKNDFDKFCSYHAKTTLLHACCSRTKDSDWRAASLSQCFLLLLEDFVVYLEKGELNNFFIPSQNLLSGANPKRCQILARCIREERDKGFPIFN